MAESRIFLIEDDEVLSEQIAEYLRPQGFTVEIDRRGDDAVQWVLRERPHLVILDLMLPNQDGLSICRQLRPSYSGLILMLTARGEPIDQVVGLELGADDYLAKPVLPRVLLAHIRALLRRGSGPASAARDHRVLGDLCIDARRREARVRDAPISLTSGEFELLWLLAQNAGQVLSRAYLYEQLRGTHHDEADRSIDLRISRLRQKLGEVLGERFNIKTIWGVGYLLVE